MPPANSSQEETMKTGTELTKAKPREVESLNKSYSYKTRFFVSDVDPKHLWINLIAGSLGINTAFEAVGEEFKEISFFDLSINYEGALLAHPVIAKAMMLNYITLSVPKIYVKKVDGDLGSRNIYMFKGWGWDKSKIENPYSQSTWLSGLTHFSHNFPLDEWREIHDAVMSRSYTNHIRDIFFRFEKMDRFGIFLSRLFEVGDLPMEMVRST